MQNCNFNGIGGRSWNPPQAGKSWTPQQPQQASRQPTPPSTAPRGVAGLYKKPGETVSSGASAPKLVTPTPLGGGLTVTTKSQKDEMGIQTLVGDYVEHSTNHNKKVYKKVQKIPGHEDIEVFLYYWDSSDGAEFSGWWFGDQVGGSQVWARCVQHGPAPPRVGWKIPWDSPRAEPGMLFVDPTPVKKAQVANKVASGPSAPVTAPTAVSALSLPARIKKATMQMEQTETSCNAAIAVAKALGASNPINQLQEANENLLSQQQALTEALQSLTKDIGEARKAGPSQVGMVTELSKLSPRLRQLQLSVNSELAKIKGLLSKAQTGKKQVETAAQNKASEARDAKSLEEQLPAAQELVTVAEESVEAVSMMACPLIADPPEDSADLLKKAMEEIEAAANEAQNKITEARLQINLNLQGARQFAPETRKKALTDFSTMQQKLTEAQKKLNPYKSFKKEFHARVEARKSVSDLAEKFAAAELEVEKASMMSSAQEMSEEEIQCVEKVVNPTRVQVDTTLRMLDVKLRSATGAVKDELTSMKDKASASKKTLEDVTLVLKRQREAVGTKDMLKNVLDKVIAAEACLTKCQDAEMPFLKGIEVLPVEESTKAIAESEAASSEADQAMNRARGFLRAKLNEAKKYVKELAASVTEELIAHQTRLEDVSKKLANFKKETTERKLSALFAEVMDAVSNAEKNVEVLSKASEAFGSDALETVSTDTLSTAKEKSAEAEKLASAAMLEARRVLSTKQRDCKTPVAQATMSKLQGRVNACQTELQKCKRLAMTGDKLIKGKEVLAAEEERIKSCEYDVDKAERKVKPGEEEAALGIEAANPTDADIEEMGTTLSAAQKTLQSSIRTVEANMAGAPGSLKTAMQKLATRCKTSLSKISEVMNLTKTQRERVMSEAYVREGKAKVEELEAALEKVNAAELPFLKGLEVLPLQEAHSAMKDSESAASAVQTVLAAARTFIAQKNLTIKTYGEAASKPAIEEMSQLTERANAAAAKLATFRKDTETRKKTALMQEAAEKVSNVEAEVKKLSAAVAPFLEEEGSGDTSEEACESLVGQLKATNEAIQQTRCFLGARNKEHSAGTQADQVKALQTQLTEITKEMGKYKQVAGAHEGKYMAKRLIVETQEKVEELDKVIAKATAACAPVLEEGSLRFLVGNSVRTLAAAWRDHMKEKSLTVEELYSKTFSGGSNEDAFEKHLAELPETLGREEVAFTEERRRAIFKHIDADADGKISLEEFKKAFVQQYKCVKEITVTDVLEVSKSKTIAKLVGGELLETSSGPQTDESNGTQRIECTVVSLGKSGFITMQGNQGTKFVDLISPFATFCQDLEKELNGYSAEIQKVQQWFTNKAKENVNLGKEQVITDARTEFNNMRKKCINAPSTMNLLKNKIAEGKKEFSRKEVVEANAHVEAKERKAADEMVAPAMQKFEAMEQALKALEDAAAPLAALNEEDVNAFETPMAVETAVISLADAVAKSVAETKAISTETAGQMPKIIKQGPTMDAKRKLLSMSTRAENIRKKSATVLETVRKRCQTIIDARSSEISEGMRADMVSRGLTIDSLFAELAAGADQISENTFCKCAQKFLGDKFKSEQVKLVYLHVEGGAGGILRRRFQGFLQTFYQVVKGIAITDVFEIASAKSKKKADMGELFELIEGPKKDEKTGTIRIRGKSVMDGVEGWVTLKGNQGSAFLTEVEKPYYEILTESPLEREFKSEGEVSEVRMLKADEVVELIEGPRKQTFEPGLRVKGKSIADGSVGWFTARDKNGTVFAEADNKYYQCTSSVAMTDNVDIKDCKVMRKLVVGELFTIEEGPHEEKDAGVTRVKGKTLKDEQVGWITIKGNAGTVYAEQSTRHYCVLQEVPLTKQFPSNSPGGEIRKLAKGEAMQLLEGPREEKFKAELRVKVAAVSSSDVGWVTLSEAPSANHRLWTPHYVCKTATTMHKTLNVEGAEVVREIAVGEKLELLEGPSKDGEILRIQARCAKDNMVGWVTIRDADGKRPFGA